VQAPDVVAKRHTNYLAVTGSSPAKFGSFIVAENAKWGEAFKAAGIQPE